MRPRKPEVRLLSIAENDIAEIVAYIAEDNPAAAITLAEKIESRLARLADFPSLGRIPAEEELAGIGYRYLVVENYLVFYTITAQTLLIHRILHGARDYLNLL